MESIDALKQQMRQRLEREYAAIARDKVKRQLLDQLDEVHDFAAPQGMLDAHIISSPCARRLRTVNW